MSKSIKKAKNKKIKFSKKSSLQYDLYFLIITLILILPLVHSAKTLDANAAPRLLLLAVVVAAVSIWNIVKKRYDFQFIRLSVFPVTALYLAWMIVTLILAANPGEGTFDMTKTMLSMGLLVYLVQVLQSNEKTLTLLTKVVTISAVVATTLGIFQYVTLVSGNTDYDLYTALYNVKGLMANKNQFAISLMLMLPFVFYGIVTLTKWWKWVAIYAALMLFVNIAIIQTRSVWVATLFFVASMLLMSFVFLFRNKAKTLLIEKRKWLVLAVIIIFIASAAAFSLIKISGTSKLAKYQVASTFSTRSSNAQWRIKMWNASWQLAKDNPVFGVGAGNWKSAIIPYYHSNFGNKYQNWRRPHNDFLWVLTEKGLPGLVLFMLFFGLIFFYGFKVLASENDRNKILITLLMLSGVGAYLVASLFTFPLERLNQQVYLIVMMAVVINIYYQQKSTTGNKTTSARWVNWVILLFSGFSLYFAILFFNSELMVRKIATSMNSGRPQRAIKYADKAYSPFTTVDYNNIPIKMYRGVANMQLKRYNESLHDFQAALKDFPNQVAVLNNLAIVSSELNKNKQAVKYLDEALYLFPHYEESLSNKVIVYYRNKQYNKAYIVLLHQSTRNPDKQYKNFKKGLLRLINKKSRK